MINSKLLRTPQSLGQNIRKILKNCKWSHITIFSLSSVCISAEGGSMIWNYTDKCNFNDERFN